MIDTCDAKVASWSEDGETFIVKDTDVFEKAIIPQFFKHSKFSSFVRSTQFLRIPQDQVRGYD
jgi:heat shock transcription factor 2